MFKSLTIYLITLYQTYLSFDKGLLMILAPGGACRKNPFCSEYTKQMVYQFGPLKGLYLGLIRILSCR